MTKTKTKPKTVEPIEGLTTACATIADQQKWIANAPLQVSDRADAILAAAMQNITDGVTGLAAFIGLAKIEAGREVAEADE